MQKGRKEGFTLMELLVVVLIIGILAAVAVPQYQKSVMRVRFAKLYNLGRSYERAATEYIAATGKWPENFMDLSVEVPGGFEHKNFGSGECIQNKELYCCLKLYVASYQSSGIVCAQKDYSIAYSYVFEGMGTFPTNSSFCIAQKTNTVANKVCSSYDTVWNSGYNLITPTGTHSTAGYNYYRIH